MKKRVLIVLFLAFLGVFTHLFFSFTPSLVEENRVLYSLLEEQAEEETESSEEREVEEEGVIYHVFSSSWRFFHFSLLNRIIFSNQQTYSFWEGNDVLTPPPELV